MPFNMLTLPIFKLTATGNDFLLIDLRSLKARKIWGLKLGHKSRSFWVKKWCHRQNGIGADGMIFLETNDSYNFKWDFYNSDGSSAELCGNAARAVSVYYHQKSKKRKFNFLTKAGVIEAKVISAQLAEVRLPKIAEYHHATAFDFVRAGVPHAVVHTNNINNLEQLQAIALKIKDLRQFKKHGTNVTFVQKITASKIKSLTFERGVEDFTLSCGTGAVSAAFSALKGGQNKSMTVEVPGGSLSVVWKKGFPYLKGPAKVVAQVFVPDGL